MPDEADRWREVLARHGAALLLFARQWSANRSDAEDAVQDGFVKFWKSPSASRDELSHLYMCVRSAAMDIGRGHRRRVARQRIAGRDEASAFAFAADNAERQAIIDAALNQLPGDQREVIVMKIWGGLTFAQIAEALDVPLNTAASRYRYAIARLQKELSEEVAHD